MVMHFQRWFYEFLNVMGQFCFYFYSFLLERETKYELQIKRMYLVKYANSEDSDQPMYPHSPTILAHSQESSWSLTAQADLSS